MEIKGIVMKYYKSLEETSKAAVLSKNGAIIIFDISVSFFTSRNCTKINRIKSMEVVQFIANNFFKVTIIVRPR